MSCLCCKGWCWPTRQCILQVSSAIHSFALAFPGPSMSCFAFFLLSTFECSALTHSGDALVLWVTHCQMAFSTDGLALLSGVSQTNFVSKLQVIAYERKRVVRRAVMTCGLRHLMWHGNELSINMCLLWPVHSGFVLVHKLTLCCEGLNSKHDPQTCN